MDGIEMEEMGRMGCTFHLMRWIWARWRKRGIPLFRVGPDIFSSFKLDMIKREIFGHFYFTYWLFSVSFFLPPKGHCMVPSLSILSNNDHRETNHLLLDFVFMLTKLERLMVYVLFHDFYNAMCLLVINVLSWSSKYNQSQKHNN